MSAPSPRPLSLREFEFELPAHLIAQRPAEPRSGSRLLVLDPGRPGYETCRFRELPRYLAPGDVVVFNDTRVIPARLLGRKRTGGRIELLIEEITGRYQATARARSSKPLRVGGVVDLGDGGRAVCRGRFGEQLDLEFSRPVPEVLARVGHVPLPPYIARPDDAADAERYQTVFARVEGAIAAPTAALHFDEPLLAALAERGVGTVFVTLHVGAGTFQPIRVEDPARHAMHEERVVVSSEAVERIRAARRAGGRVVAVGTTTVRALETAARSGELAPFAGRTDLFILPGFRFRCVDALVTNFHLPRSTLLMMVCALAGRERVLDAYRFAVGNGFRFFSYGDAMLLTGSLPGRAP